VFFQLGAWVWNSGEDMKRLVLVKLVVSIIGCQLAGYLGSLVTRPAISTWYASLKKPSYGPPDSVFGPVWISLYLLMGIAVFLVWRQTLARSGVKAALLFFVIQLILNAIWPFLFFGLRSPLLGLADILLLWLAIVLTIILFYRVATPAALLLIPYILWVSFAAVLNFGIWRLNPGSL